VCKRALILLTRSPFGRTTGRITVLRTIMKSIKDNGFCIDIAIFDKEPNKFKDIVGVNGDIYWVGSPSILNLVVALILFIIGLRPLNEYIYYSGNKLKILQTINRKKKYDVCIIDMIRLAKYGEALNIPYVIDFDDLLSKRYSIAATVKNSDQFLGYFDSKVPLIIKLIFSKLFSFVLRKESQLLIDREIYWTHQANSTCLVSSDEAIALGQKTGRKVFSCPMAINLPENNINVKKKGINRAVFVGGLDYQPNLDALRYYISEIYPVLIDEVELQEFQLDVIGYVTEDVELEFKSTNVNFLGYVDDLDAELASYTFFLAPIVTGSGLKTKILDAMANRLVVISTELGVEGIPVENMKNCLVAKTPLDFSKYLIWVGNNSSEIKSIGENARKLIENNFSFHVLKNMWKEVLLNVVK
jgi:glycosyltransferase involved in cell wall biosynthesis